ncbi:MAG: BrnT family toxin [Halioglobus sp.]|nr:BrnT family toxin [Halioglobus sp.]
MREPDFEWDEVKNAANVRKHGVSFYAAQHAFLDPDRVIAKDLTHSQEEKRYYCFGVNREGSGILAVRFMYRSGRIRIIGAGYWRKGKQVYEQANSV